MCDKTSEAFVHIDTQLLVYCRFTYVAKIAELFSHRNISTLLKYNATHIYKKKHEACLYNWKQQMSDRAL